MKYAFLLLGIAAAVILAFGAANVWRPATLTAIPKLPRDSVSPLPILENGTSSLGHKGDSPRVASGTSPEATSPENTALCNGKRWLACDPGLLFSCPKDNGDPECIEFEAPVAISPRQITAKGIVGLLCYYSSRNPQITRAYADSEGNILSKASGVVVSPEGYILTARHLVDPAWANEVYASTTPEWERIVQTNIDFKYCEVGLPPSDTLPTVQEIKTLNSQLALVHPFPYVATIHFIPSQDGLSDLEYRQLDFAVLKISGARADCANTTSCVLPAAFPYNPMLISQVPPVRSGIVSFGYPAEAINTSGGAFTNFFLKGAVGNIEEHYGGDKYFNGKNFVFRWSANNIISGRSGSPIFWNGYVIGLFHAGSSQNSTVDYALTAPAIYRILTDHALTKSVHAL